MAKIRYRFPRSGDVMHIAAGLREADRQELIAARGPLVHFPDALARAVLLSSHTWVAEDDEGPIAIFGVAPVSLLDGVGSPWFLSTERAYDHPRALVSGGRHYLSRMRAHYPELFNYVDARNERSIRWLGRLGFTLRPAVPYGNLGLPFHKFEIGRAG